MAVPSICRLYVLMVITKTQNDLFFTYNVARKVKILEHLEKALLKKYYIGPLKNYKSSILRVLLIKDIRLDILLKRA